MTSAFNRHAEKYGVELVYETAAADGLAPIALVRLKLELRRIADAHRKARQPLSWWQEAPRVSDAEIALLHADGATPREISVLVGLSLRAVYKALARHAETFRRADSPLEQSHAV